MHRASAHHLLILGSGLAVACDEPFAGTPAASATPASEVLGQLTGIYEMTSFTENKSSCDTEGASALAEQDEKMFVLAPVDGGYGVVAQLLTCTSIEDCRAKAQTPGRGASLILPFAAVESDRLTGTLVMTGFGGGGKCKEAQDLKLSMVADGNQVKVERRGARFDYPSDARGMCRTDHAKEQAAGKPCNDFLVISGKRVASIATPGG